MATRRTTRRRNGASEARELYLYATNTSELYNQFKSITLNLAKKKAKGTYDSVKAIKLWTYWMDAAAKRYTREFDAHGSGSSYGIFTASDRREAAKEMRDFWETEWGYGNYDSMVPAKYASKKNPQGNVYLSKASVMKAANAVRRQGKTVKVWKRWAGNHEEYWITIGKNSTAKNPGKAKRAERRRKSKSWTDMGLPSLKRTRTMPQYLYRARSMASRGGGDKAPMYRRHRANPGPILSVPGRGWIQESWETGDPGIKRRATDLRKKGYKVVTFPMGLQVTQFGHVKLTMVDIRPGTSGDAYLEHVGRANPRRRYRRAA